MAFKYCVIGETCYQYIRNNEDENNEKEKKFREEENIIPYQDYEMYSNFKGEKNNLNFTNFMEENNNEIIILSDNDKNT
jgi:hypothetical protein